VISLKTRRKILFSLLYLGEGAPIGFIWWTLPTLWKDAGMGVPEITAFTSVVIFPWIFKFIWSPLIDVFRNEKWNFKAWILGAQSMMILSLLPLLFMDFSPVIFPFLFIHAIAASTQDAAIDAYAISVTPKEELGSVNGWMQFGMLAGRAGIGGLGIVFANKFGWLYRGWPYSIQELKVHCPETDQKAKDSTPSEKKFGLLLKINNFYWLFSLP
jgi:MFS transporter, PAT family, beta-lactamase induction signal transducer AmpG